MTDKNIRKTPRSVKCVVITGPTATGKTSLGVDLARQFNGEIVSADSRQVYRHLDIGTGKDLEEYSKDGETIPYHCIDVAEPQKNYNLFRYQRDAARALQEIVKKQHLPIIVGGTPLYINALLENYALEGGPPDPQFRAAIQNWSLEALLTQLARTAPDVYQRTDKTQRKRVIRGLEIAKSRHTHRRSPQQEIDVHPLLLAPFYPRPEIHARIESRLDNRLKDGLLREVEELNQNRISWERLEALGLEYRYAARHLRGELSWPEFRDQLLAKIRQFCRSQEIWFRKMEREGRKIYWIPRGNRTTAKQLVRSFLAGNNLPEPQIQLKNITYGPKGTRKT